VTESPRTSEGGRASPPLGPFAPRAGLDTLRGRLLLLVALATLPALAFILYASARERSSSRRGAEGHAMVLARLAGAEHGRQIRAAEGLLARLAPSFARPGAAEGGCPDLLPALVTSESRFANVGVLAPSGRLVCSAVPPRHPVDLSHASVLAAALRSRKVVVGDYEVGPIVERPVLYVAVAARDATGAAQAVPFAALDLRWLEGLVRAAALPPGSVVTIFDRRGRVLARSRDSARWVGRELPVKSGFARLGNRREGVFGGPGVDGVDRLWAFHRPPSAGGVSVTVGIPSDVAFAAAERARRLHVAGFAVVLLFAIAMGVLGAELSVLRGVRSVTKTARRLAAGELGARAPVAQGAAEIRELAVGFNAMAGVLELRQRQSEDSARRLRALAARIQTAREEEATRIARELHDEVGQALTALKLDVAWMGRSGAAQAELAALASRIDETIGLVRRLSQELRPALLDRLGLGEAIAWQARELEARAGLSCKVEIRDLPAALDPEVAIAAFRIAQEALTNVVRHADARTVTILAAGGVEGLVLEVSDDGKGMDVASLQGPAALGIQGMRERALLLGGSLVVDSVPGQGTTVRVRLPLPTAGHGGAETAEAGTVGGEDAALPDRR